MDKNNSSVILGFALDVSGSMKQNILNKNNDKINRFQSFNNSLEGILKRAKNDIKASRDEGEYASIEVFSYLFGLRNVEYCDMFSLMKVGQEIYSGIEKDKNSSQHIHRDPYEELAAISRTYGIKDMANYLDWLRDILNEREAQRLAIRLHEYPRVAERLTSFLPESFSEVEGRVKRDATVGASTGFAGGAALGALIGTLLPVPLLGTAAGWALGGGVGSAISFVGVKIGKKAGIKRETKKLEKPEALARELANAPDDEVRKILFREAESEIFRELHKRGETTLPLEDVADLFESSEGGVDDVELLIYGMTPMRRALRAVLERFAKERAVRPDDTVCILFILSDGQPNDGDPLPVARTLKDAGVHIVTCFVTDQDITRPHTLFTTPEHQWTEGARFMFEVASSIDNDSVFTRFLMELGWTIPSEPKLFVQVNHSDILDEFVRAVFKPLKL
jgi:hypothetical protein